MDGLRGLFQGNQVCDCVGAVPPDIVGEEQNVSVLLGQALELRCQGSAVPPPRLAWLRDGRPLLEKPGLSISADGSVLKVSWAGRACWGSPWGAAPSVEVGRQSSV